MTLDKCLHQVALTSQRCCLERCLQSLVAMTIALNELQRILYCVVCIGSEGIRVKVIPCCTGTLLISSLLCRNLFTNVQHMYLFCYSIKQVLDVRGTMIPLKLLVNLLAKKNFRKSLNKVFKKLYSGAKSSQEKVFCAGVFLLHCMNILVCLLFEVQVFFGTSCPFQLHAING